MRAMDLTGRVFGLLTVIERIPPPDRKMSYQYRTQTWWRVECACGNPKRLERPRQNLVGGHTISCGCQRVETNARAAFERREEARLRAVAAVVRQRLKGAAEARAANQARPKW